MATDAGQYRNLEEQDTAFRTKPVIDPEVGYKVPNEHVCPAEILPKRK